MCCLIQMRSLRYKGGTLIAEDVTDLATHEQRIRDPSAYRPSRCPRCGCHEIDAHDYPTRTLRQPQGGLVVRIIRYICRNKRCGATWRILPAFIPRHLWRSWPVVEETVNTDPATQHVTRTRPTQHATLAEPAQEPAASVPRTTARRWSARFGAAATHLVALLAANIGTALEGIAKRAGLGATRRELTDVYTLAARSRVGHRLADLAALLHRLANGIRLV
jgi:hypothetical protein